MSFQTCMSFFLMLKINKNIFWRKLVIKQLMVPIDFHSMSFPTVEVNGDQQLFLSSKYFKISSFVFNIRKKLIARKIHVWNDMRLSKWWKKKFGGWIIPSSNHYGNWCWYIRYWLDFIAYRMTEWSCRSVLKTAFQNNFFRCSVNKVKSSHLYLYSAFNNTNCDKATAQYQNGKIVSIM